MSTLTAAGDAAPKSLTAELGAIQAEYHRRQKRRLGGVAGTWLASAVGLASILAGGHPLAILVGLIGVSWLLALLMTWDWRCPSCSRWLGPGHAVPACPHCKVTF